MTRSLAPALIGLLLVACGGGDDDDDDDVVADAGDGDASAPGVDGATPDTAAPLDCEYPGSAVWQGAIDQATLDTPISAWAAVEADNAWWIVGFDEAGGHCFTAGDPGGAPPADGYQGLTLIFDGAPATGTYTVVSFDQTDAPADAVWVTVDRTGPGAVGDLAEGISGTVIVDEVEGCISGSFDITFVGAEEGLEGGTATGAFAAYLCLGA